MAQWKGPLFSEVTTKDSPETNRQEVVVVTPSPLTGASLQHVYTKSQATFLCLMTMGIGEHGYFPVAWMLKDGKLLSIPMTDYTFLFNHQQKLYRELLEKTKYPYSDLIPCPLCHGAGVIWKLHALLTSQPQEICSLCSGKGSLVSDSVVGMRAINEENIAGVITSWNGKKYLWEGITFENNPWKAKAPTILPEEVFDEEELDDEEDEE